MWATRWGSVVVIALAALTALLCFFEQRSQIDGRLAQGVLKLSQLIIQSACFPWFSCITLALIDDRFRITDASWEQVEICSS
jgi:hypothetical protein